MTTPPVYDPSNPPAIQTLIDEAIANGAFPSSIVHLSKVRIDTLNLGFTVVERMPDDKDPSYTVGIVAINKSPDPQSIEINGAVLSGATMNQHLIVFYTWVRDADRVRGTAGQSIMAEVVEQTVAQDAIYRQALGGLTATVQGQTKKLKRWWIRQTRYLSNEISGTNQFMSATEVIFETETVS